MRALTAGKRWRPSGGASERRRNVQGDFWLRDDADSGQGIIVKSHKFDQTNFSFLCCGHRKCVKSSTNAPRLPGIRLERQVMTITSGPVGTNPSSPHQFHAHFWYPALSTQLFFYLLMATRSQTSIIKVMRSHSLHQPKYPLSSSGFRPPYQDPQLHFAEQRKA